MTRIRRVADRQALEQSIDEFITRGYRLRSQDESSARLKETDWGDAATHLIVAVLTVWWTFGLANAIYAFYAYVNADEVLIRIENESEHTEHGTDPVTALPSFGNGRPEPQAAASDVGNPTDERIDAPTSVAVDTEPSPSPENDRTDSRSERDERFHAVLLQTPSLLVAGFVLLSIFALHTGTIDESFIPQVCLLVATAVGARYALVHHPFARQTYKALVTIPLIVGFLASAGYALRTFTQSVSLNALVDLIREEPFRFGDPSFLPRWWSAILLTGAGLCLVIGVLRTRSLSSYTKPSGLRTLANSPVTFGLLCALFGIWAVLLVGFAIQRIIVIAPIFEELLKFGLAILVGSALFGRSLSARIGVALVVGALFGLVEHTTSYPLESDLTYLFRTCFHASSTMLSVTSYTIFERVDEPRLKWIAPAYAILIHFIYNTFVVLSALISVVVFGQQYSLIPVIYGGVAILLIGVLIALASLSHRRLVAIHRPFEQVLSHLV